MEDVAEALNLKLSAAKMRVHRGLEKLRDILGISLSSPRGTSINQGKT
jgi:DNA-directed RNA polymerase specialized sigma24 family protein